MPITVVKKTKTKSRPKKKVAGTVKEAATGQKVKMAKILDLTVEELETKVDLLATWKDTLDVNAKTVSSLKADYDAGMADMQLLADETVGADIKLRLKGKESVIELGTKAKTRKMTDDREAIITALDGAKVGLALECAGFKVGDLDKYLMPEEVESLVEVIRGRRSAKFAKL